MGQWGEVILRDGRTVSVTTDTLVDDGDLDDAEVADTGRELAQAAQAQGVNPDDIVEIHVHARHAFRFGGLFGGGITTRDIPRNRFLEMFSAARRPAASDSGAGGADGAGGASVYRDAGASAGVGGADGGVDASPSDGGDATDASAPTDGTSGRGASAPEPRAWHYNGIREVNGVRYHYWRSLNDDGGALWGRTRVDNPSQNPEISSSDVAQIWMCPVERLTPPTTGTPPAIGGRVVQDGRPTVAPSPPPGTFAPQTVDVIDRGRRITVTSLPGDNRYMIEGTGETAVRYEVMATSGDRPTGYRRRVDNLGNPVPNTQWQKLVPGRTPQDGRWVNVDEAAPRATAARPRRASGGGVRTMDPI